jgi:hypothetical protein
MRIFVLVATGLAGASLAAEPPRPDFRIPTKDEIARCPKLQGIDWKKVRKRTLAAERQPPMVIWDAMEEHRRIRGPRALPDLARAEVAFDISIGPGKTQEYPTSTSSFVWREKGGPWQLDRVDETTSAPSPPPPNSGVVTDAAWNELARRPHTRGPLSASQAQELDRLLADPCFLAQPDAVPFDLPMKKGNGQPCWGSISSTVRMQSGGRLRLLSDPCGRGYGFDLARIVMYGSLDLGTVVTRALAARLKRDDITVTELKLGKSRSVATLLCGTAETAASKPLRFTYSQYRRGPYLEETLVFPGETDPMSGESFDRQWEVRCSG